MYEQLQEELQTRLPTMDDIVAIGRVNPVVNRALKLARQEGLSESQSLMIAVAWLAIHNNNLLKQAVEMHQQLPPPSFIVNGA